jgi:hypothetical protein
VIRGQRNALEVAVPKRPDATLTKEGSMFIFLIKRRYTNEIRRLTQSMKVRDGIGSPHERIV